MLQAILILLCRNVIFLQSFHSTSLDFKLAVTPKLSTCILLDALSNLRISLLPQSLYARAQKRCTSAHAQFVLGKVETCRLFHSQNTCTRAKGGEKSLSLILEHISMLNHFCCIALCAKLNFVFCFFFFAHKYVESLLLHCPMCQAQFCILFFFFAHKYVESLLLHCPMCLAQFYLFIYFFCQKKSWKKLTANQPKKKRRKRKKEKSGPKTR